MEVGDLVKARSAGVAIINESIKNALNMDCIGVITEIHDKRYFSYDGRDRGDVTVQWSNGNLETIPEIYLERVEHEQRT